MKRQALEIGPGINPIKLDNFQMTYLDFEERKIPNKCKFVKHNLNILPLPFKDNSFDIIIAENVLEHLIPATIEKELWLERFQEFHRILKQDGELLIRVPHYTNSFIIEHRTQFSVWDINYIFGEEKNWIKDLRKFNFELKYINIEFTRLWKPIGFLINKSKFLTKIWESYLCYIIRATDIIFILVKK